MGDQSSAPRQHQATWRGFAELMRWRVQQILLVSSLYDSFILAEDDPLNEVVLSEFLGLDLQHVPDITHVSSGAQAIALARADSRHNLVITSPHVEDMDARSLVAGLRDAGVNAPVVVLAYDRRDLASLAGSSREVFEDVFLWQGDAHVLVAIVKSVEDRLNLDYDVGVFGVQVILVVEDSIGFASSFLPLMYREVMAQARRLVPEGVNRAHKMMRVQARPKIVLCRTYEEAWTQFCAHSEEVLGVISDVEFPRAGVLTADAGAALARHVRKLQPDVPIVLQSERRENEALAREIGAEFLLKGSPTALTALRHVMVDTFGFGPFVFRTPDSREVGRAEDLRALEEVLRSAPAASIAYHAERNHFSRWLKARTEFAVAHALRPRRLSDFASIEHLRDDLVTSIREYRRRQGRGTVTDFSGDALDPTGTFARIGGGSLGGKARGLAFVGRLLLDADIERRYDGVQVGVPATVVIGTDVFDEFLQDGGLRDTAMTSADDEAIAGRFEATPLPRALERDLADLLRHAPWPLAVRSSSLLEDSQYQPFAGVYDTFVLPNNHPDPRVRLAALTKAIRRVYASMFSTHAKAYLDATSYRLEEEKMAVMIQRLVGAPHGPRFYPDFAGVARSYNFYAYPPLKPGDGIAAVALGLGAAVVEGEQCLRFCPRYPRHLVQFSSVREMIRNSQRDFHALRLIGPPDPVATAHLNETWGLDVAETDGTLRWFGSTYARDHDMVYDGLDRPGPRLVTFAPILKQGMFPLPEVLADLLALSSGATGTSVEIEFAATLSVPAGQRAEFAFLQLRPLAAARPSSETDLSGFAESRLVCRSSCVLGNGEMGGLHDLIVVDFHRFERMRSREVAQVVASLNASLWAERRPYLLIGVGRWGSNDALLGIPVTWPQIRGAAVIVETGFRDLKVAPSQGSHFFQNLVARNVGYFTVNPEAGEGFVDWEWLTAQPAVSSVGCVRHLRFAAPVGVRMNGRANAGVIVKPEV